MDSIVVQKLFYIGVTQDSILNSLHEIRSLVINFKSESFWIKVLPFIGVIVGGIITYFGQNFLKRKDIFLLQKKEVRDNVNNLLTNIVYLKFLLKEMAYMEVANNYQYYLSNKKIGNMDGYTHNYKYITESRAKIWQTVSEIYASCNLYYKHKKIPIPPENIFKLNNFVSHFFTLKSPKQYDIDTIVTQEMTRSDSENFYNDFAQNIFIVESLINEFEW